MNVKHIAATLAILGSTSFAIAGCGKKPEGTEVPAGDGAGKEGSCGAKKDGSCAGDKKPADAPADAPAEAPAEAPAP